MSGKIINKTTAAAITPMDGSTPMYISVMEPTSSAAPISNCLYPE